MQGRKSQLRRGNPRSRRRLGFVRPPGILKRLTQRLKIVGGHEIVLRVRKARARLLEATQRLLCEPVTKGGCGATDLALGAVKVERRVRRQPGGQSISRIQRVS